MVGSHRYLSIYDTSACRTNAGQVSCCIFGTIGPSAWETLLPWQQDKEKEGLEDLAELALGAGDLLRLTDLPGAFRIYK